MSDLSVAQTWGRIDTWLQTNAPAAFAALNPGASETELQNLQDVLGVGLPPDVVASYRIHNGTPDDSLSVRFAGWYDFFNCHRIQDEWTVWKELLDGGDFAGNTSEPRQNNIRPDWWNPCWIPLTGDGGGNHLCVDLAPGESGAWGQIITMWHDDEVRSVAAPSFAELLTEWADDLEAGKYVPTAKYGLVPREDAAEYGAGETDG